MRQVNTLDAIQLDPAAQMTLVRQLYDQLRSLMVERMIAPGSAMPSTRQLAKDLGIGRNTVIAAYDQLIMEGYLQNRKTARPIVIDLPIRAMPGDNAGPCPSDPGHPALSKRGRAMIDQHFFSGAAGEPSFHPGMPDAEEFPFTTWSRMLARRAAAGRDSLFGTYDLLGFPPLRRVLANHLNAARGMRCHCDQILIVTGAQAVFNLLARMLLDPGDTVWMEEPGYFGAQSAFVVAGARLAPMLVDSQGWMFDALPDPLPKLINVTPSCHHPLGATMRMEQRLRLLEIAESCNAWIIEDDYDSEYRFQGQPMPAMQGMDATQRVIYVGTFSKLLFPALRIGFAVLPRPLIPGIAKAIALSGYIAPLLLQAALFDFIDQGHLARHLRRTRRLYSVRRDAFHALCDTHLADWLELAPGQSGIQTAAFFRCALGDELFAASARKRGINVSPLSIQYRHGNPRQGLLLGYAATPVERMAAGIQKLRATFIELASC